MDSIIKKIDSQCKKLEKERGDSDNLEEQEKYSFAISQLKKVREIVRRCIRR